MYLLRPSPLAGRRQAAAAGAAPGLRLDPARGRGGRRAARAASFGVAADVWSATSFTELRRDGIAVERWNRLHPTEPPRKSWVETVARGARRVR